MIDLDPAIVDQETLRKKRRKKLLLISLGPEIVLVIAGIFFLRPVCADILYRMNFDSQSGGAIAIAKMQQFANLLEPYIAYYNAGTASIQQNNAKEAEKELRQSLANNPPQHKVCHVRVNLSYSIEMQADDARANERLDEALALLSKAEGVLYENGCASKDNTKEPSKDSHAEEAKKRINGKRNQVISSIDSNYDEESSGNENQNGSDLDSQKVETIRNMIESGPEIRNMLRDNSFYGAGNMGGGDSNYNTMPDRW
ncbi:hypothetical protein IKQ65_01645 [Candidatus Saccharibacteria bacterium]|nr:hypothetical protein [Candidatus Saccharibacteria bacterium]